MKFPSSTLCLVAADVRRLKFTSIEASLVTSAATALLPLKPNHQNFMKTKALLFFTVTAAVVGAATLHAAPFNSGSTGSYGAMNITSNVTLDIPLDGIFHCTTINVSTNGTLTFRPNALNTPVYLLAQSNVVINGTINLSGTAPVGGTPGQGGPGGFDGGFGGFALAAGGDGKGPGGGINNPFRPNAAYAQIPPSGTGSTNTYGNALLSPLIGGSGGAGGNGSPGGGGGGGGGAILIAANGVITVNGSILCNGGSGVGFFGGGGGGGGSGGGIRLVAPMVNGSGILQVNAGVLQGFAASLGRIRIDCEDRYAFRSLRLTGVATRGAQMFVFPPYSPRLDIVEAGGQVIPAGTTNSVSFNLPPGPSTNIIVRVQATDFTNNIPIRVVVTPENGSSTNYNATIDISQGNPASTNVTVTLPAGTISTIHAWTR